MRLEALSWELASGAHRGPMQPSLVTPNQSPLSCGVSPVRHTYYWLTCEKKVTVIQHCGPLCAVKLPQKHKMEGCSDFVPQAG